MINLNIKNSGISNNSLRLVKDNAIKAFNTLMEKTGKGNEMLGWLDLPINYDRQEFERIKQVSKKIQSNSDVLVVIGIGGSYLGARAGIEFCQGQLGSLSSNKKNGGIPVLFAGNSISSQALKDVIEFIKDRDFSINVISKSGTTTEPAIAFRILKNLLVSKYGKEIAKNRIFATTDANKGALHELSNKEGYEQFVVPDSTGGRFSVLTAVGLLPMCVAGLDIDLVMQGAKKSYESYNNADLFNNDTIKYAACRYLYYNALKYDDKKTTEILANYEPSLVMFGEWFKQLYAESEGKEGNGIFPAGASFSTDLHSIGQFIQDGTRNLFETVLWVENSNVEIKVPYDAENIDGLNFASDKSMHYINKKAMQGTMIAHVEGGCPNLLITIDRLDEFNFGELVYFFWKSLAISAYMLHVNPFDQPGVEAYKKNMFALLGKPGYENEKTKLEERLQNL